MSCGNLQSELSKETTTCAHVKRVKVRLVEAPCMGLLISAVVVLVSGPFKTSFHDLGYNKADFDLGLVLKRALGDKMFNVVGHCICYMQKRRVMFDCADNDSDT